MSYREKQTALSLLAVLLVYGAYYALAWRAGPGHGFADFVLAVIALILVQILGQAWLALRTRAEERSLRDEREDRYDLLAVRIGYYVLLSVVLMGSWVLAAAPGRIALIDAGLAAVVLAEAARYGAFLVLVRRTG